MATRTTLVLVACAVSCAADERPPGAGAGFSPTTPGNTSAECEDVPGAGESCVRAVKGAILDGNDRGVTLPVNLCNAQLCFSTRSDEGLFTVDVKSSLDLSTFLIHAYGYPYYGDTMIHLKRSPESVVTLAAPVYVARLDSTGPMLPSSVTAPLSVAAGPVSLTLAAGSSVAFYPAHDARELRVGRVPPKAYDPSLVAVYALGPFGAKLSSPAEVAIDVSAQGLADGRQLVVVELEDDLAKPSVGRMHDVGMATVTAGVARSAPGTGIRQLTWVGLRPYTTP